MDTVKTIISAIDFKELFALLGTVGTLVFGTLQKRQRDARKEAEKTAFEEATKVVNKDAEIELLKDNIYTTKLQTLKQVFDVRSFSSLEKVIQKVYNTTDFDRFTIMFLMNGKIDFNYMSVIFDQSKNDPNIGDNTPYHKLPIDDYYHGIITGLPAHRAHWEVTPFTIGDIGQYIELELIKTIGWFRVKRIPLDDFNDLLVYCSWSSDKKVEDWRQRRRVELITTGRMAGLLDEILSVPKGADAEELLKDVNINPGAMESGSEF